MRINSMKCDQDRRSKSSGESGVGCWTLDFRDSVAEIRWTFAPSPSGKIRDSVAGISDSSDSV